MLEAVQAGDLARAQTLQAQLYPVTSIVCQAPGVYLHVRYKEAAFLAGRIRGRAVRPPQLPIPAAEQAALVQAMARRNCWPASQRWPSAPCACGERCGPTWSSPS